MELEYLAEPSYDGHLAIIGQKGGNLYMSYGSILSISEEEDTFRARSEVSVESFIIENEEHYKYLVDLAGNSGCDVVKIGELDRDNIAEVISAYACDLIRAHLEREKGEWKGEWKIEYYSPHPYISYAKLKEKEFEPIFEGLAPKIRGLVEENTPESLEEAVREIYSGIISTDAPYDAVRRLARKYFGIEIFNLEGNIIELKNDLRVENYEEAAKKHDQILHELSRLINI